MKPVEGNDLMLVLKAHHEDFRKLMDSLMVTRDNGHPEIWCTYMVPTLRTGKLFKAQRSKEIFHGIKFPSLDASAQGTSSLVGRCQNAVMVGDLAGKGVADNKGLGHEGVYYFLGTC